ncbi:unnamed protein product [Camellia sinensis]
MPLFGGLKATFVTGYGILLQDFLFETSDGSPLTSAFGCPLVETVADELTIKSHSILYLKAGRPLLSLDMDYHCKASFLSDLMVGVTSTSGFGCPLVETVVDELTIKVILPEGSKHASAVVPFPLQQHLETSCSYLDVIGNIVAVVVPGHKVYFPGVVEDGYDTK